MKRIAIKRKTIKALAVFGLSAAFASHGLTALGACDGGKGMMDDPRAWTILNMDCNYYENCKSDDIMSREAMDRHVGERLKGPVTHFFVNPQGMVACYPSKVVETVWSRPPWIKDDPMKKDWVRHLKTMFDRGLDRFQIFIDSARKRGVEGWISMRMNDVHGVDVRDSQPCSLWHDHPEFWRVPNAQNAKIAQSANWMSRAFDYSHKEVREHHIRYAEELLERYDMDGFDVDWTRFPAHLPPGKERSESECLTEVMRAIRHRANLEAARRGHRVLVSATVLSSPEAALGAGMDVIQWAREGLLDVVIVANFFFCMDFDTPYAEWVRLLHNVNPSVRVVCRADCNVAIYSGAIFCVDGAGYRGYYDNMIAQGCRDFGFFNLFETDSEKAKPVIAEGIMSGAGRRFPRKYIFTYRDYVAEGTDAHRQFPIKLDVPRKVSLLIGSTTGAKNASLEFALDGKPVDGFMPTVNGIPAIAPVAKAPDVRWYEKYYEGKVAPPDSYRAKFSVAALKDGYNEIVFPMLDGATVKCAWLVLE